MIKAKSILEYFMFFIGISWLYVFAVLFSTHEYDWMLSDSTGEPMTWCSLPWDYDDIREGMYLLFLFQFTLMSLAFVQKKNWFFNGLLFFLFCYATYLFMVRDMLCVSFLR